MAKVTVKLGTRSYDILIESGALTRIGEWVGERLQGRQVLVVADENTAALFGAKAVASMRGAGLTTGLTVVPAGEESKSLAVAELVYTAAIRAGLDRDGALIALGGGVVGDLAGFVAATYLRGVDFLQVPTTLLAQVDSSVGGKVAVNHQLGKNLIGAFYQPRGVLIDPTVLASLPAREFSSGMAEVLKYGMIADAGFLAELVADAESVLLREPAILTKLIATCCRLKAAVVERDERDAGERAFLNFGHTAGHAIETAGDYRRYTHGEAVALGMLVATRLSEMQAQLPAGAVEKLRGALERYGLPVAADGMAADKLLEFMRQDKKRSGGAIHWVLLPQIGRAESRRDISDESVRQALQVILPLG